MAEKPISTPLPADLPTNWETGQTVSPTGTEVGLTQQHGYNYQAQQINDAQTAINAINDAFENVYGDGDTVPVADGGTGATTAAQAAQNLNVVPQTSGEIVKQYTHAKSGVTHNLTGPAGAKVIQFVATADYASGDLVAVNGITLKATDLRGLSLPDKVFVTGSDVIALVPNSASGGSITFQVLTPASNPNLLDNWYFIGGGSQQGGGQFPINQRGQTSYTGTGYGIDRWLLNSDDTLTVSTTGVTITLGGNNYVMQQLFESPISSGEVVTVSALFGDGFLAYASGAVGNVISTPIHSNFAFQIEVAGDKVSFVSQVQSSSIEIIAAKLELGPVQTLAHQDADGNWVLNDPPPNFQQELAKCQRYQCILNSAKAANYTIGLTFSLGNGNSYAICYTPVPMRTTPSISVYGSWKMTGENTIAVELLSMSNFTDNLCKLQVSASGETPGYCYSLQSNSSNSYIILDANL